MRIAKLTLNNFRGVTRDFDLPAACIVAGPNFSGKSTVPIALRLACVGSMPPPIGKTGIWPAFAGNPDEPGKMSVTATTDNGVRWSLEWERKKETVSQRGQPPVQCALPPVLCDPLSFWSMTVAEQSRTIFAASGETLERDRLFDAIRSVDGSPAKIRDDVVALLEELMRKRLDANPDVSSATTLWVSDCSAIAKDERAKAKRCEAKTAASFWSGPLPKDRSKDLTEARQRLAQATRAEESLHDLVAADRKATEKDARRKNRIAELQSALELAKGPEPAEWTEEKAEQYARADETATELNAELERINGILAEKTATRTKLSKGVCPCCGHSGDGLSAILEKIEVEISDLTADHQRLREQKAKAVASFVLLETEMKKIETARAEWERRKTASDAANRELDSLLEFTPEKVAVPTDEQLLSAKGERERCAGSVAELEGAQAEFARWAVLRDERDKAESDLIRARCSVDVTTEAMKRVSAALDEVAGKAFVETLMVANRLCDGLLASPLEFRDGMLGRKAAKQDVERTSGVVREGAWIPHTSFSGTEALIGYAGFAVAVASKAPFRLVVMDELNRLTSDRKRSLISRILLLIREGVIDQFVGCDPEASDKFELIDAARWEF